MRWRGRRESRQVEDRRGAALPGGRGLQLGCGSLILLLVLAWLTGQDPLQLLDALDSGQVSTQAGRDVGGSPFGGSAAPGEDELAQMVSVVLADTEDTWEEIFRDLDRAYDLPTLVLFREAVSSACGFTSAAVGPFYCPRDRKLYIDLAFFSDLDRRFGAPGDFAQAYVVAHEVGHHVQNLLGISGEVHRRQSGLGRADANELSVRLELQADCLAGVWGHYAASRHQLLEPGDMEEGLQAASAIGDDRLQRRAGGRISPESFTHGSSDQRVRWFRRGLEEGRPEVCDTFGASRL